MAPVTLEMNSIRIAISSNEILHKINKQAVQTKICKNATHKYKRPLN